MRSVLVTGGTGSFGRAFVRRLLDPVRLPMDAADPSAHLPRWSEVERVIVFSRDELKQHQMRADGFNDPRLRFFIGDVRDRDRLRRAMAGVDVVVHAAALKQVDTCELNPLEAKKTNVDGTSNVIDAALDVGVGKVLMLGTDKAVDPTNLYGATKLVAEKLVIDANAYSGAAGTVFAATRYGNVISSRGSVLPVFQAQHARGEALAVTDPAMTRFVLTLEQGVDLVVRALTEMRGGEVFVPKLPAVTVETIAEAVQPGMLRFESGLRPGEKLHELLVSRHEASRTRDRGWCYCVEPLVAFTDRVWPGEPLPAGFEFSSLSADRLDVNGFRRLAGLERRCAVCGGTDWDVSCDIVSEHPVHFDVCVGCGADA